MNSKIPFLRKEYFSCFSADFLEMPREELYEKMPIVDIEHTNEKEGAPITFYTTVRSLYTNKVLTFKGNPAFYFESVPNCNEFSTLAELSILAAKGVLGVFVDLDNNVVRDLVAYTTQPYLAFVGVICDKPIVYMNVLCSDDWVNSTEFQEKWLKPNTEWRRIESIYMQGISGWGVTFTQRKLYEQLKICNKESNV